MKPSLFPIYSPLSVADVSLKITMRTTFIAFIFTIISACLLQTAAFHSTTALFRSNTLLLKSRNSLDKLFAKKEEVKSETEYWQGEWVCADCGYVYDRDIDGGGLYFEQQKKGFICPQCSAPRKRYAKKVGDQWGVTRGLMYFLNYLKQ